MISSAFRRQADGPRHAARHSVLSFLKMAISVALPGWRGIRGVAFARRLLTPIS